MTEGMDMPFDIEHGHKHANEHDQIFPWVMPCIMLPRVHHELRLFDLHGTWTCAFPKSMTIPKHPISATQVLT